MAGNHLVLERCPHSDCGKANPALLPVWLEDNEIIRYRRDVFPEANYGFTVYQCTSCRELILARRYPSNQAADYWPQEQTTIDQNIHPAVRKHLKAAQGNLGIDFDYVILACSGAIDVMLQLKGVEGKKRDTLFKRIELAQEQGLITEEMAKLAHQVRFEGNISRHPSTDQDPATRAQAKLCFDFAMALAEMLFALPARITQGIERSEAETAEAEETNEENEQDSSEVQQ